ncbi:porphobilinogen synthase [Legionella israelensis]|uniref:Delta-aminolevulinic acid dehydratase n=1 Tax=Legionella israelensis TaxID=454 RepID=A0A0W0V7C9_9GAMM|nr:porphobilinogen synthase [Legionella israelensis]KTD16021.1 delta-aminolevulinic acid dehydratases (porphobilinogen synthase) [Legionella israelensis]QBS08821.1 porphobilinogen synthase [Legionella israelensis]SCY05529.1 porphobilinogen synthase [Legionella israelensis DSM 19235]STX58503.1 delta-aminolevulinic acid dehydratases (porphobilinogen synthase) [Legionella israelensis]
MSSYSIPLRLTRLRRNEKIRSLIRETRLSPEQLIAPLFINQNIIQKKEISSMPGQYQFCLEDLPSEIDEISQLKIPAVVLFGIPEYKDECGSSASRSDGIIQQTIEKIRNSNKDIFLITDLCFCEYTDHGHCGILKEDHIDNDSTLEALSLQAVSHARAGADCVAPSGMVDGMVGAIRNALDENGFHHVSILSYSVKYCSSLYGPFREAAEGAPKFGDRKTYQMDPANGAEALREAQLDLYEGADMLMVKPAMNYLDVIYRLKQHYPDVPLCAYQVSGEYAMLKAAASKGWINEQQAMVESLTAIKRAGADFIISYYAKDLARLLSSNV